MGIKEFHNDNLKTPYRGQTGVGDTFVGPVGDDSWVMQSRVEVSGQSGIRIGKITLSRQEIADRLQMSRLQVQYIFNGKRGASPQVMEGLAELFETSMDEIWKILKEIRKARAERRELEAKPKDPLTARVNGLMVGKSKRPVWGYGS